MNDKDLTRIIREHVPTLGLELAPLLSLGRAISGSLSSASSGAGVLSDAEIAAIWKKCDMPSEANNLTTGPVPFARAILSSAARARFELPCDCDCTSPAFTEPMEALRFLSARFKHAGVSEAVAESYARDIDAILAATQRAEPVAQSGVEGLREALESIAENTCCDRCQEAALVARAALSEVERDELLTEARNLLEQATDYTSGPAWSPSMTRDIRAFLREVDASPSPQPTDEATDAARWREVVRHVGGARGAYGEDCFALRTLKPVSDTTIFRGSVAEHFTKAIDAARLATPPDNAAGWEGVK